MENEPKRMDIIVFMAPVNEHTISHLIDLIYTADGEGSAHIFLHLSSIGGKLHSAFTAYNYLRSLNVPFHTHNTGNIEGAALMLYLASDHRSVSPNSRFVLTNLDWRFGHDYVRFGELHEAYQSLKHDIKCYSDIFNERTNRSLDVEGCLTGAARVLDPEESLKAGIVTDPVIASPSVPELAKLWLIHS